MREGLAQHRRARRNRAADRFAGITGDEQHREVRVGAATARRSFPGRSGRASARRTRSGRSPPIAVEHARARRADRRRRRAVAEFLERADRRGQHARIVLDDQDVEPGDRRRAVDRRRPATVAAALRRRAWRGQIERDGRALARRRDRSRSRRPIAARSAKIWLRPSPVPLPTGLVVKNGSNTRSSTSGVMPQPVSATAMRDIVARRACADLAGRQRRRAGRDASACRARPSRRAR